MMPQSGWWAFFFSLLINTTECQFNYSIEHLRMDSSSPLHIKDPLDVRQKEKHYYALY